MAGNAGIREGTLVGIVAAHDISRLDPALASVLSESLAGSVVSTTQSSYRSGLKAWARFCNDRGLDIFPVDRLWFAGWVLHMASSVKVSSLKMYMAGVRYHQELEGWKWRLAGDPAIRMVLRYLRRKFPSRQKAAKVPVTTGLLRKILVRLEGWPVLSRMSFDDAVFAAASVIGVSGFLRGGEFLSSAKSVRPVLMLDKVRIRHLSMGKAVVVSIVQPKTRWWLDTVDVPCFENVEDPVWCPVRIWSEYAALLRGAGPAFRTCDGTPVARDWMVERTEALMRLSGIRFVSPTGEEMKVKMASWRSGGVRSAMDAGVHEELIRMLGRWRSSAWRSYLLHSTSELQGASRSLWSMPMNIGNSLDGLQVAECEVGGCFVAEVSEAQQEVEHLEQELGARRRAGGQDEEKGDHLPLPRLPLRRAN